MNQHDAISVLAALAQDTRLDIVRYLIRVGPSGAPAGIIAEQLALAPATLSFHVRSLLQAGLVRRERQHRLLVYRIDLDRMQQLLAYLTEDCCGGHPERCLPGSGAPAPVTRTPSTDEARKPMPESPQYNVLFLCTGNSARSILAEAILNDLRQGPFRNLGRFRAYSAGSHPTGQVQPLALEILRRHNIRTEGLHSKSWEAFAGRDAPEMDFVFTVCDSAAAEVCPVWPGHPLTAHWGVPDPAAVEGSDLEKIQAFREAFRVLENRIRIFTSLPIRSLDRLRLQRELDRIGGVKPREGAA